MSADPLLTALNGLYLSYGYQTQVVQEPKYRDYDPQEPTVYISPVDAPEVHYHAFGRKSVKQLYEAAYLIPNKLSAQVSGALDSYQFKQNGYNLMGPSAQYNVLFASGAWYVRVQSNDYDKSMFKQGITATVMQIRLDYIQNN